MRQRPLRSWLTASFRALLVPVAVLLAIIVASLVVQLGWLAPRLSAAIEASAAVQDAHNGMLNQETGLRGFLLVPASPVFLAPYDDGQVAAAAGFARARTGLTADAELTALLEVTRQRAESWQQQWARSAVLTRSGTRADAEQVEFLSQGKALFDAYRAAHGELVIALDQRTSSTIAAERSSVLAGLAAALIAGLGVLASLRRQRRRLSRAIVDPTVRLAAAVSRHAEGQLDPGDPDLVADLDPARTPLELSSLREEVRTLVAVLSGREAQLHTQVERSGRLLELTRRLTGSLDREAVAVTALEATLALAGLHDGTVWLAEPDPDRPGHERYRLHAQHSTTVCELRSVIEVDGSVAGRAAASASVVDELVHSGADGTADAMPRLAVPFVSGDRVVGLVELRRPSDVALPPDLIAGLEVLATAVATALQVAELHDRTREMTLRDPLTHLYNRRRLDEDLDLAVHLASRAAQPFAVVMIDIDHFKGLNDTLGHQTGDEVLREVADVIADTVRGGDTAYRYGGEEFLVLTRDTNRNGGRELAERVRHRVAHTLTYRNVTVSCGVAAFLEDAATAADLVAAADQALYAAKRAGRNRTATASETAVAADTLVPALARPPPSQLPRRGVGG